MNYGIHLNDPKNLIQTIETAMKLKCSNIQIFLGDKSIIPERTKPKPTISSPSSSPW